MGQDEGRALQVAEAFHPQRRSIRRLNHVAFGPLFPRLVFAGGYEEQHDRTSKEAPGEERHPSVQPPCRPVDMVAHGMLIDDDMPAAPGPDQVDPGRQDGPGQEREEQSRDGDDRHACRLRRARATLTEASACVIVPTQALGLPTEGANPAARPEKLTIERLARSSPGAADGSLPLRRHRVCLASLTLQDLGGQLKRRKVSFTRPPSPEPWI